MAQNIAITPDIAKSRRRIADLEGKLGECEQLELEPVHYFSEGLYARELTLPEGSCVVGKIHKHAHLNVIIKGECRVSTPFGMETYRAPCVFESKPDTKRAVYAITETTWITFHPTDTTDVCEIEKQIILPDYSDRLALEKDA